MKRICLLLCLWMAAAFGGEGVLRAVRATKPVYLDGRLDEAAWKEAPVYGVFVNTDSKAPSPLKHEVKVLYDDKALYVGIWCEEPNVEEMKLEPRPRDAGIFAQDCVELMLDPAHTRELYWHFMVGAHNWRSLSETFSIFMLEF